MDGDRSSDFGEEPSAESSAELESSSLGLETVQEESNSNQQEQQISLSANEPVSDSNLSSNETNSVQATVAQDPVTSPESVPQSPSSDTHEWFNTQGVRFMPQDEGMLNFLLIFVTLYLFVMVVVVRSRWRWIPSVFDIIMWVTVIYIFWCYSPL